MFLSLKKGQSNWLKKSHYLFLFTCPTSSAGGTGNRQAYRIRTGLTIEEDFVGVSKRSEVKMVEIYLLGVTIYGTDWILQVSRTGGT